MRKFIKILTLVMAVTLLLSVVGCSKPSKDEVLTAYKQLYQKAFDMTDIIYGSGLPYESEGVDTEAGSPNYVPVSDSSPYKTVEELKAAVLEVFSEEYYENTLKYVLFEKLAGDENGMTASAAPRYIEKNGKLMIDSAFNATRPIQCDVEGAYIVEIERYSAVVGAPRSGSAKDKNCYLVLTENGWRFGYRA